MSKEINTELKEAMSIDETYWREELNKKKSTADTIPINLILDTNWWIYLANGEHPVVLKEIIEKLENDEFQLLTCELVLQEWDRRLIITRKNVEAAIFEQSKKAYEISEHLTGDEKEHFKSILKNYKNAEEERVKLANNNIDLIDEIIKSKSVIIPVTDNAKELTLQHGIEKKAPFKNKNSTAYALIFFSSIDYLKSNNIVDVGNSIFVTYNSEDFSQSKQDKDRIHDDLKEFLESTNTVYERNIGKVMKLTEEIQKKIDEFIEYKIESEMIDEYIEIMIDNHIHDQIDLMRGK